MTNLKRVGRLVVMRDRYKDYATNCWKLSLINSLPKSKKYEFRDNQQREP